MAKISFAEDCRKEEIRHADRCVEDEWYCFHYVKGWILDLPYDSLDELDELELELLRGRLEETLDRCINSVDRIAVKSLIGHIDERLSRLRISRAASQRAMFA